MIFDRHQARLGGNEKNAMFKDVLLTWKIILKENGILTRLVGSVPVHASNRHINNDRRRPTIVLSFSSRVQYALANCMSHPLNPQQGPSLTDVRHAIHVNWRTSQSLHWLTICVRWLNIVEPRSDTLTHCANYLTNNWGEMTHTRDTY